jgi:hypothetical protein
MSLNTPSTRWEGYKLCSHVHSVVFNFVCEVKLCPQMRPRKCVSAFAKSTEFTCTSEFAPNMASLHVSRVGVLGPGVRWEPGLRKYESVFA